MNTQSLASAIIADAKSKTTDELKSLVFETVISEYFGTIVDIAGGN